MLETAGGAHKTGLEFAPGTTDDCRKLVGRMFENPADLLGAYRTARETFNTSDIVLAASDQEPEIQYVKRVEYAKQLRAIYGKRASELRMWSDSAQSVVKLPKDSEAFWLVLGLGGSDEPIMCVIYAVPYNVGAIH